MSQSRSQPDTLPPVSGFDAPVCTCMGVCVFHVSGVCFTSDVVACWYLNGCSCLSQIQRQCPPDPPVSPPPVPAVCTCMGGVLFVFVSYVIASVRARCVISPYQETDPLVRRPRSRSPAGPRSPSDVERPPGLAHVDAPVVCTCMGGVLFVFVSYVIASVRARCVISPYQETDPLVRRPRSRSPAGPRSPSDVERPASPRSPTR